MTVSGPQPEPFLFLLTELTMIYGAFLLCSVLFSLLISLCVSLIPCWSIASHCDPVCVRGRSVCRPPRSPSWNTQAPCLAWIGIWFHLSLISEPPSSSPLIPSHVMPTANEWTFLTCIRVRSSHMTVAAVMLMGNASCSEHLKLTR